MSNTLPINLLRDTPSLVAFHSPKPLHPIHIIIMPKRSIKRLMDLTPEDADLLSEVVTMVQSLVEEFVLQEQGFRLIVNGGKYQTVGQLHFHLVSGETNQ